MFTWSQVAVVPGVEGALTRLQGEWTLALATNAADSQERDIWRALERVGLEGLIDRVYCFLGFLMLGIWILGSSFAGLRHGSLPKLLSWFGIVTSLLCFCFAVGYVTHLEWLGEMGIGASAFFAAPVYLAWVGIAL
jgi:hypothetical protein